MGLIKPKRKHLVYEDEDIVLYKVKNNRTMHYIRSKRKSKLGKSRCISKQEFERLIG